MAVSVVSFSSLDAQLEAQGLSSLLDDGFLYCILSRTGLQNFIGGPEGPFSRVWLSLPHAVSDVSDPQLIRAPRAPSVGLSLPHLISNFSGPPTVWLPVITELYNSSTPTLSPTQPWNGMFDRHQAKITVMHRSLSSGASLCSGTVGLSPCPILSAELTCAISLD